MSDEIDQQSSESTPAPEVKYTDADMQRAVATRLSKEQRRYQTEIESLKSQLGGVEELKTKLAQLEEEREMAGKTATERAQAQAQKELDKLRREIEERDKRINEATSREAKALSELRADRATTRVMSALSSEKAINAERAAKYAMTDITINHAEDGSMTATYGEHEDVSVAEAVKHWLRDNDNFLPAPPGGAGTRANGARVANRPLHELHEDELLRLGKR